jgi:hypothetical protein
MTYFHEYLLDDPDSRVHQATYTHGFFIHLPVVKVAVFSWWACCLFANFHIFRFLLSKFLSESWSVFLFWDCWRGNSSPIKTNRFWLSWSGTMVSCGARTHTHTLSLPVLSLTSLNWREDWLQLESGIQSGIIKFDISLSTSTVSGVLSYERKLKYQSHLISIGLRI